jgi:hypothetical protein
VKSWTRTLNLDDTHTLLAKSLVGISLDEWTTACHTALPSLSVERRRELIRMIRGEFLTWTEQSTIEDGLFIRLYHSATAMDQIDMVHHRWAASHPLTLETAKSFIAPILEKSSLLDPEIPLRELDLFVAKTIKSKSKESLRKSRTVLINALESIGVLTITGTGKNRVIRATRGAPSYIAFTFLLMGWMTARGDDAIMTMEAIDSSLPVLLTGCTHTHAEAALAWADANNHLIVQSDEVSIR